MTRYRPFVMTVLVAGGSAVAAACVSTSSTPGDDSEGGQAGSAPSDNASGGESGRGSGGNASSDGGSGPSTKTGGSGPSTKSGGSGPSPATGGAGPSAKTGGVGNTGDAGSPPTDESSGGAPSCEHDECVLAVRCVTHCGGPVISSSCCACEAGLIDIVTCFGSGGRDNTETGGSSAGGSGGSTTETGGSAGQGGSAGAPSSGGSGGTADPAEAIADPDARGTGICADETVGSLVAKIHEAAPDLADIDLLYDPKTVLIGDGSFVYTFRSSDGFRFVLVRGSGDCPAGCIDHEYWYFETDENCDPSRVGHYARTYQSSGNCFRIEGQPLWGLPEASDSSKCPEVDLTQLNSSCQDGTCPAGLTPITYYGIAGPSGPEFCSCSIPCQEDPKVCPSGTSCVTIADGPGTVCSD